MEITYVRAQTYDEREAVVQLVTEVYMREGYINEGANSSDISAYLLHETTDVITAWAESVLVGTISLAHDSPRGIPMDVLYRNTLQSLRDSGARIAEVCQFAIDREQLSVGDGTRAHDLAVSTGLLGHLMYLARFRSLSHLTFAIHPKHRVLYESLGAVQIGEEAMYPSVNRRPALGYVLDMHVIDEKRKAGEQGNFLTKRIFETVVPDGFVI